MPCARPWLHHARAHGNGPPQNSSRWATPWPSWARPLSYPPTPLTVYCLVLKWLFWLYHETARHKTSTTKWAGLTELPLDPVGRGHWDTHLRHWQESRSREIFEEKLLKIFSLGSQKLIFMYRSPLDFQEMEEKFLFLLSIFKTQEKFFFLLSIFKIVETNFSVSCRFSRFSLSTF